MTDTEASYLNKGDIVEVFTTPLGWGKAEVLRTQERQCILGGKIFPDVLVRARRIDLSPSGNRRPYQWFYPWNVRRLLDDANRVTANVYADWLEDRGERKAAALLRANFPLEDGK